MLSKDSHSTETQPETGPVAESPAASSKIRSRLRWVLYATAAIAVLVAAKYFHVQDLLKEALDWIAKLGPWGPVIFVGIYVGRYLARDAIARKIEKNEKFAAIDRAVADEGWKIVFLTRLSPVFPFTLLNYAFGLTRVKLSHYVLASWIGMMPGTVMYVYLGSLVNVGAGHRQRTTGEWVLYGVGLLATIAVTIFVTRMARKALEKKISSSETSHKSQSL